MPIDMAAAAPMCENASQGGAAAALSVKAGAAGRRLGLLSSVRALGRTRRSAVAMEMAAVALPFFMLLLGTFEVAFDLYVQSAMNLAMGTAARLVWEGKVQGPMTYQSFVTQAVCPTIQSLLSCGAVIANVHPISPSSDFWNTTPPPYTDGTNLLVNNWTVCTGGPGQFVLLQMVYAGPSFAGLLLPSFTVKYLGTSVHATYTSTAIVNQAFTATQTCNT